MSELTSMQAACWFGRGADAALGGVAAHLYVEFDGQAIDLQRLNRALERVCQEQQMLRLRVSADGEPSIGLPDQAPCLEVDDFTALGAEALAQTLLSKRTEWTHQQLDLMKGQTFRCSVSLQAEGAFRLHIDTDMIAIDPASFCTMMEQLALFYADIESPFLAGPSFFEWCDKVKADPELKQKRANDRSWWQARLPRIAPAPSLPLLPSVQGQVQSHRLSAWLQPDERKALQTLAREQRITLSSLMLGLFALTLGEATGDRTFRLNVPFFWRHPVLPGVDQTIGDYVNFVVLDVDMQAGSTAQALCQGVAEQMISLLGHGTYPGVNLMRDLSRYHGSPQLAPVVFTSGLDLPGGELFSDRVRQAFGSMNWAISQGPQVALDAQVASVDGGILINWDIRLDALPQAWITRLFEAFVSRVQSIAANKTTLSLPPKPAETAPATPDSGPETGVALTAMQRSFLLGRTAQLPLGGVAMQEFREYQGQMDVSLLSSRLQEMVRRHECLRTCIDSNRLLRIVSDNAVANLTEVDLSFCPPGIAETQLNYHREQYTHVQFELSTPPWDITVFRLAAGQITVFVRFDALILDGRSIALLMLELFEGQLAEVEPAPAAPTSVAVKAQRKADEAYWAQRLAGVRQVITLPWNKPLAQAGVAHYERQSLSIPAATFTQLGKVGGRQGLFKNSTLMALILDVLSHWVEQDGFCVAVPVAPLYSGPLTSNSTFIVVDWQPGAQALTEQAARLQTRVLEGLQHLAFSGVDLARMLFERCGPGPVLPVVITNGLSWPVLSDASPVSLRSGLTQTPQVALDIRFSTSADGALKFDIDYVREVIASEVISDILAAFSQGIAQITASDTFAIDLAPFSTAKRPAPQPSPALPGTVPGATDSVIPSFDQIADIYRQVLCLAQDLPIDATVDFTTIGLRPQHLKVISARVEAAYSIRLSPAQLLPCRNLADVERLLQT